MTAIFRLLCSTGVAPITAKWLTCCIIAFPSILLVLCFFMKRNRLINYITRKIENGSTEYDEDTLDLANTICHISSYLVCIVVLLISFF